MTGSYATKNGFTAMLTSANCRTRIATREVIIAVVEHSGKSTIIILRPGRCNTFSKGRRGSLSYSDSGILEFLSDLIDDLVVTSALLHFSTYQAGQVIGGQGCYRRCPCEKSDST